METYKCEICGKEFTNRRWNTLVCSDECFTDYYWLKRVKDKENKNQVIINQTMYYIGREDACGDRGFDGAVFYIHFFDGRNIRTTNLWTNDKIPEKYREELPDNARWMTDEEIEKYDEEHSRTSARSISLGFLFPLE